MDNYTATNILGRLSVEKDQDFHTLTSVQVERVLQFADEQKYRRPKNANGSRARYFYEALHRAARRKDA